MPRPLIVLMALVLIAITGSAVAATTFQAESQGLLVSNCLAGFGRPGVFFFSRDDIRFYRLYGNREGLGFHVIVVNADNGRWLDSGHFDVPSSSAAATALLDFLAQVPQEAIVLAGVANDAGLDKPWATGIVEAFEALGSTLISQYTPEGSWSFAAQVGHGAIDEALAPDQPARVSVSLELPPLELPPPLPPPGPGFYAVSSRGAEAQEWCWQLGHITVWLNGQVTYDKLGGGRGGRGISVAVVAPDGTVVDPGRTFDTWGSDAEKDALVEYLDGVRNGALILAGVADDAGLRGTASSEALIAAFERLGSHWLRAYRFRSSWAFAVRKGVGPLAERLMDGRVAELNVIWPPAPTVDR